MIGPNALPTAAVPKRCTEKRPTKIATVLGTTHSCSPGLAISSPSTALRTLIAGVIAPSPYKSAAPTTASTAIQVV